VRRWRCNGRGGRLCPKGARWCTRASSLSLSNQQTLSLPADSLSQHQEIQLNNAELQLGNVRWAMIDVMRHRPPGFEDAVRSHFRLLRHRLMETTRKWVEKAGAGGAAVQRRLDAAVVELHALLAAL
jgi:hypothetical protein